MLSIWIFRRHTIKAQHRSSPLRWISTAPRNLIAHEINEANERYRGRVEIRAAGDRGWGLFANSDFGKGDLVMQSRALSSSRERDSHSIQTGHTKHVRMDLPARFLNHVCGVANLGIKDNELGAYDFFALRDIRTGEEITWDYEAAEYQIQGEFLCSCGSLVCRKRLLGYRYHRDSVKKAYGDAWIASYLQKES